MRAEAASRIRDGRLRGTWVALATVVALMAGAAPAQAATKTEKFRVPEAASGLSCVSTGECVTAVNQLERFAFRFDPTSGGVLGTTNLTITRTSINDIFCSTRTQCTMVGNTLSADNQREIPSVATFDPTADSGPRVSETFDTGDRDAFAHVSCPTPNQCTAIARRNNVLTFDPNAPAGTLSPPQDYGTAGGFALLDIACPTARLCAATTQNSVRTFDPTNPAESTSTRLGNDVLGGIDCPSATQCTVSDGPGFVVTFDPANPASHGPPVLITDTAEGRPGGPRLGTLSCPSTSQCTVIHPLPGAVITFDPKNPKLTEPLALGVQGEWIECPTVTQCTMKPLHARGVVTWNAKSPETSVASPATALATPETIVKVVAVVPRARPGAKVTTELRLNKKLLKKRTLKVGADRSILYRIGKIAKPGTYTVTFTIGKKVVARKRVKVAAG